MPKLAPLALAMLALAACGDDDTPDLDASQPDAALHDAGSSDGSSDGSTSIDGSAPDGGAPDSGPSCDAAPALPALKLEAVPGVGSLDKMLDAEQPKGTSDWYLVQQTGTVRILRAGALLPGNFVDVRDQITLGDDGDERGLLGIAFPPDYTTSGKFYIALTATKGDGAQRDTVYEYQRAQDGLSSSPTGKVIVQLPPSASNHNGGNLQFGPDGYLYFGSGDGGGGCNSDEPGAPQDPSSPFGKILRFDPNAQAPYAAPGNPFSSTVLHYGLRNPFRFGFDRQTGDLYIGDVGQDSYEEVDYAPAGSTALNFGWPIYEGDHMGTCPGNDTPLNPGSTYSKPIVDLPQNTGIWSDYVSVIGGVVYRGAALPALRGVYLFGDYQGARMGAIYQCGTQTSPPTQILKNPNPNEQLAAFARPAAFTSLTAIVEDGAGELYFVVNRSALWKVVPGG